MDILVYAVGGELFAAEMRSADNLDFRRGGAGNVQFLPVSLPDKVSEDCLSILKLFNLNFAAIDLRRTPDDEYVFFEANPTPVFRLFEHYTRYPIGDRLADLLMSRGG